MKTISSGSWFFIGIFFLSAIGLGSLYVANNHKTDQGTGNTNTVVMSTGVVTNGNQTNLADPFSGSKLYFQNDSKFSGIKSSTGMVIRNAYLRFSGIPEGTRLSITDITFSGASSKQSLMLATGNSNYIMVKDGSGTHLQAPMSSSTPNIDAIPVIFTAIVWKDATGGIVSVIANWMHYEVKIEPK